MGLKGVAAKALSGIAALPTIESMELILSAIFLSIICAGIITLRGAIRRDDERNRRDRNGDDET